VKRFFCILSLTVLFGCGQENSQMPAHLLPQDKMVQILADVHIAEARIENRILYPDTALMVFSNEQQRILERHAVEEKVFRETYRFYLSDLRRMDKLYEIILDTLSVREAKARIDAVPPSREPSRAAPAKATPAESFRVQ
jgi:hypothetical protein